MTNYSWDWAGYGAGYGYAQNYSHRVLNLRRDLLSITTLTNADGNVISSTGYWLEPRNDPPYRQIRLRSSEAWIFNTDGEVSVNGQWGFSSAPPLDIVEATLQLAAYLYRNRDNPVYDVTASPEIGVITVPKGFPAHVRKILENGGYINPWSHVV